MTDITAQLQEQFADRLKEQESMSRHTNFRIGGPARWFLEIKSEEDLVQAVRIAKEAQVPYFFMGGGSNLLVSDKGFDGLVIKMAMRAFTIEGTEVEAEAGAIVIALARKTVEAGLKGFEWAISLPGPIGGAVRGNAGCFGAEMKDVVTSARVLHDDTILELTNEELKFGYRDSHLKHQKDIVLSVKLQLENGDRAELEKRMEEILHTRKTTQPISCGSAGCLFKNYEIKNEEEQKEILEHLQLPDAMLARGQISAGWLVDQMGLKGATMGDAQISEVHANFLLNLGNATAEDVLHLITLIKTKAKELYGIDMHEEVQTVGFDM